jgi:hypothetical protein
MVGYFDNLVNRSHVCFRRVQVLDVARGLHHMHEGADLLEPGHGMVHSALNIFNVLIKDSGRAVISGFGHAKVCRITCGSPRSVPLIAVSGFF